MLRKTKNRQVRAAERNKLGPTDEKGQSLVEMALVTPLLLLLFIGVLEVGWAIRGYIVLVNVDREATRFAARGQYLDWSQTDPDDVGYGHVISHALRSLSQQLPFDVLSDEPNGTVIITHYLVDTGQPCEDPPCNDDCAADRNNHHGGCDCSTPERREPDFHYDDLILHPGVPGYEHFTALYGISRPSHLNHDQVVAQLKEQNDVINCQLNVKDQALPWSPNSVVVIETFYDQPQLLGVPIISNHFTDPVPMYAHTAMRINASRGNRGGEGEGHCMAYPITFDENIFDDPDSPSAPQEIDAYEGDSPGNFGWITWNPFPGNNNAGYVEDELRWPQMSMTDFTDVLDPNDHGLSIGDNVSTKPGVANSDGIDELLQKLVGKTIVIPVYDNNPGSGSTAYYHISHFAKITVKQICLPRNSPDPDCSSTGQKKIVATFEGYVDDTCGGLTP